MKKLVINKGTRGGYISEVVSGMVGKDAKCIDLFRFGTVNKEKDALYETYKVLDSLIVRELATITFSGKSKIVLVNDDFVERFLEKIDQLEKQFKCSVAFDVRRPVATAADNEKKLRVKK